ncbi:hypothetical protein TSMG0125 [Halocynthia phage JM-2012]|uniref:hypothetical protein n=1 Tax=Halocynthia phage JM-2012 TaxID=1173297 RepID=UPI00025C6959|nr:hypothetical protein TSMG0125 [Halocynthia phage JM-2012]AFI55408.1 hypothetical protein TSMG0125 [Halocynthia phage JM-2012]
MSTFVMKDLLVLVKILLSGDYTIETDSGEVVDVGNESFYTGNFFVGNDIVTCKIPSTVIEQLGGFKFIISNSKEYYNALLGNKAKEHIKESINSLSMTMSTR